MHNKRPMASLHRFVVLLLLGTARAPPPGNDGGGSDACAEDGSSATYTETITSSQGVDRRRIQSAGCPNHESYCTGKPANKPTCDEEGLKGGGTEATDQGLDVEVPANPKLLDADAWAAVVERHCAAERTVTVAQESHEPRGLPLQESDGSAE